MYEIKTKKTKVEPKDYVNSIEDKKRKDECIKLNTLFKKLTKETGQMYGDSIVGFCDYSYETKSKCVGNWFNFGFSSRKTGISIYVIPYNEKIEELQKSLGKAKLGKSCIVVKSIEDIDLKILEEIIKIGLKNNN